MNQILSLVEAARASSGPSLYSDDMLSELLTLHQEMIEQLRRDRLRGGRDADFLTGMIAQHEKAAAKLRAQLEIYEAESA